MSVWGSGAPKRLDSLLYLLVNRHLIGLTHCEYKRIGQLDKGLCMYKLVLVPTIVKTTA